jgi:hypothetical protein
METMSMSGGDLEAGVGESLRVPPATDSLLLRPVCGTGSYLAKSTVSFSGHDLDGGEMTLARRGRIAGVPAKASGLP